MRASPADSLLLSYLLASAARPETYYGSRNLGDIRLVLEGWRAHRRVCSDADGFADAFFGGFHAYVEQHYGDRRTIGWNGLIGENTSSEAESFEVFMSLLTAFAAEYASAHS